jgi:peptidoglycan/LPS O-acetylase OafA/YrhL
MPRPAGSEMKYLPGLDGMRAIAVAAIVGYHLGAPWLPGGLLGVGVFFTLSGYLITTILLTTWDRRGDLDLRNFWLRRARRLLPALIMVLIVVLVATPVLDREVLPERGIEALVALTAVSNWTTIASDVSYAQPFSNPGPLDHLWPLAVEEQFYLLWPLLLLLLFKTLRGRLERMALVTLVLATVSFLLMLLLAAAGFENLHAYQGTEAGAGGLLIGAALAMVWPTQLAAKLSENRRHIMDLLGVGALAIIVAMFVLTDEHSRWLSLGGLLLLSLATAVLVAAAVHPASVVGPVLGVLPLRWIGERSYGIYLWHLPVVAFLPQGVLAAHPLLRAGGQLALIILLSALSWAVLENPIRRHGLLGALGQRRYEVVAAPAAEPGGDSTPQVRTRAPALVSGSVALLLIATASLTATAALRPTDTPKPPEPPAPSKLETPAAQADLDEQ